MDFITREEQISTQIDHSLWERTTTIVTLTRHFDEIWIGIAVTSIGGFLIFPVGD